MIIARRGVLMELVPLSSFMLDGETMDVVVL